MPHVSKQGLGPEQELHRQNSCNHCISPFLCISRCVYKLRVSNTLYLQLTEIINVRFLVAVRGFLSSLTILFWCGQKITIINHIFLLIVDDSHLGYLAILALATLMTVLIFSEENNRCNAAVFLHLVQQLLPQWGESLGKGHGI